jgi:ammonium transporter, Amt family
MSKTLKFLGAAGATLFAALPAFAQEAAEKAADGAAAVAVAVADGPIKAPTVEQMAGMVDKGDTTWMLISSALVLLMSIPALALFYGGLVRTKNMLSLLMQVFMIVSRSRRLSGSPGATAWPSPAVTPSSVAFKDIPAWR